MVNLLKCHLTQVNEIVNLLKYHLMHLMNTFTDSTPMSFMPCRLAASQCMSDGALMFSKHYHLTSSISVHE